MIGISRHHMARWGQTLGYRRTIREGDRIGAVTGTGRFIVQGEDDSQETIEGIDPRTMCLRFYSDVQLRKDDVIVFDGSDYRIFKVMPQMQGCGWGYTAGALR
ncbi:MAG: hypothetical protein NC548_32325 [Lachnospiraceae bacterium]|nr:hypothetical protein [Lachnospiraceae bacterium]